MFLALAYVVWIRDGDLLFHLLTNFMRDLNWNLYRNLLTFNPGHWMAPFLRYWMALLVVPVPLAIFGIVSLTLLFKEGLAIFLVILLIVDYVLFVTFVFKDWLIGCQIDGVAVSVLLMEETKAPSTKAGDCKSKYNSRLHNVI